jgi:hypothetical protein
MRFTLLFCLAFLARTQAISPRYQYMQPSRIEFVATPCRLQQLSMARRHLEAVAAQLSLEVQELLSLRRHATEQFHESLPSGKCDCESSDIVNTPAPAPAQPAADTTRPASWELLPLEPEQPDSSSTSEVSTSTHHSSFLACSTFVLLVFLVVTPAALVIGFVLFCKRRRRRQHTHA